MPRLRLEPLSPIVTCVKTILQSRGRTKFKKKMATCSNWGEWLSRGSRSRTLIKE